MLWNGLIGSVAAVINTALPLFFGRRPKDLEDSVAVPVGPATLYADAGVLKIGNFHVSPAGSDTGRPILLNFSSARGAAQTNLSIAMPFGQAFKAEPWLKTYTYGDVTVGTDEGPAPTNQVDLMALWSYTTQSVMGVLTVMVNPTLTLRLQLDVSRNVVIVTAMGAATILGTTYMLTARNNAGQEGSRSGTLHRQAGESATADPQFVAELPTGINYANGVYGLTLQLPINLSASSSMASDERVEFETVSPEKRAALRALLAR
jgi:hypothetical protein